MVNLVVIICFANDLCVDFLTWSLERSIQLVTVHVTSMCAACDVCTSMCAACVCS